MEFAFVGVRTDHEWASWQATSTNIDTASDGVRIAREQTPTYVSPQTLFDDPTLDIVDIDQDDCGTLYVLDATGTLYVYENGIRGLRRLGCRDADEWGVPRALCVTDRDILIAYGTADRSEAATGCVRAISKAYLQTRWVVDRAMVPSPTGDGDQQHLSFRDIVRLESVDEHVLVLDRSADTRSDNGAGLVAELSADGIARVVVDGLATPNDIALDEEGNVYVLLGHGPDVSFATFVPQRVGDTDRDDSDVIDTDSDGLSEIPVSYVETPTSLDGASIPPDIVCIAVAGENELIAGMDPRTTTEKTLFRYLPAERRFERVSSFKRSCGRLIVGRSPDDDDRVPGVFAVDGDRNAVTFLERTRRNRWNGRTGRYDGQAIGRIDSGLDGTRWHRVTLSAILDGLGVQLGLRYLATDNPETRPLFDERWTTLGLSNPEDVFLEEAVGRYLWIRLDLLGEEFVSPHVDGLRAYFPRQSYLRYLPAIYEEEQASREFLERFLSLFETIFVGIEEEIDHLTRYSDAGGVPAQGLGWLAEWLALQMDETWPETARRELITEAISLFRTRGTRAGLSALLDIYLRGITAASPMWHRLLELDQIEREAIDAAPDLNARERERFNPLLDHPVFILEYADLDCIDDTTVRETFERFLNCPQCFLVLIRPSVTDEQFRTIQTIVETERPAHAVGRAVELRPWLYLGGHTYLGINSVLSSTDLVVGRAGLGHDAVLTERDVSAQLGVSARVGDGRL